MASNSNYVKINARSMRQTAIAMISWLEEQGLWQEIQLIVRGWRYTPYRMHDEQDRARTKSGAIYYVEKCEDVRIYDRNANPETITIILDGPLYSRINTAPDGPDFMMDMQKRFISKYGMYFDPISPGIISCYVI